MTSVDWQFRTSSTPNLVEEQMISAETDDHEIIESVLGGDRQAFRFLVLKYQSQVFAMLMRQVADRDLAEELAQECFLRAFRELKTFRREAKFSSWLIRIALNLSNTYFASKRFKQNKRTKSFEQEDHTMSTERPDKSLEHREALSAFRHALQQLSPKLREVMVLCGLEGKPYEEAANLLAIPVGTVRSRLNQARLELRTACAFDEFKE